MPAGLRAGTLNRRLRLQTVAMVSDAEGVSTETWTDLATVWAHISPASGRETFQAAQPEEVITHTVTVRWRPDITSHMRFLYSDPPSRPARIFLIHTMLDQDELHRQIDCMCEEIVTTQVGAT